MAPSGITHLSLTAGLMSFTVLAAGTAVFYAGAGRTRNKRSVTCLISALNG